ncbi:MAG: hypothetical protein KGZ69_15640, partial [Methylomonas sp.]|nr:hypothetical protein [Methylomonas sp.]
MRRLKDGIRSRNLHGFQVEVPRTDDNASDKEEGRYNDQYYVLCSHARKKLLAAATASVAAAS